MKQSSTGVRILSAVLVLLAGSWSPGAYPLNFQITYEDNAEQDFAVRGWLDPQSHFQRNIRAAAAHWGRLIDSNRTILLTVRAERSFDASAAAAASPGHYLGSDSQGNSIWESGPLSRIRTGVNPGEAHRGDDMRIWINPARTEAGHWMDPDPESRTAPLPSRKRDFYSLILHELVHGFGMDGYREWRLGSGYGLLDGDASVFDTQTYFVNGTPLDGAGNPNPHYFSGAEAVFVHGQHVLLTHLHQNNPKSRSNFHHLGDCDSRAGLVGDVMTGCGMERRRYEVSLVDLAIIGDLGYPTRAMFQASTTELYLPAADVDVGFGDKAVYRAILKLIDPANLLLQLIAFEPSSRSAGNSASYDPVSEVVTLSVLVESQLYAVTMRLVGTEPLLFQVESITPQSAQ